MDDSTQKETEILEVLPSGVWKYKDHQNSRSGRGSWKDAPIASILQRSCTGVGDKGAKYQEAEHQGRRMLSGRSRGCHSEKRHFKSRDEQLAGNAESHREWTLADSCAEAARTPERTVGL